MHEIGVNFIKARDIVLLTAFNSGTYLRNWLDKETSLDISSRASTGNIERGTMGPKNNTKSLYLEEVKAKLPAPKPVEGQYPETRDGIGRNEGRSPEDRVTTEGHTPENPDETDVLRPNGHTMTAVLKFPPGANAPMKLLSSWGASKMLPKYLLGEKGEGKRDPGTLFLM